MSSFPLLNFTCLECADQIVRSFGLECPEQIVQNPPPRCFTCLRREGFTSSLYPLWYEINTPHATANIFITAPSGLQVPEDIKITGPMSRTESEMQRIIRALTQPIAYSGSQESVLQGQGISVSLNASRHASNSGATSGESILYAPSPSSQETADFLTGADNPNQSGSVPELNEAQSPQTNPESTSGAVAKRAKLSSSGSSDLREHNFPPVASVIATMSPMNAPVKEPQKPSANIGHFKRTNRPILGAPPTVRPVAVVKPFSHRIIIDLTGNDEAEEPGNAVQTGRLNASAALPSVSTGPDAEDLSWALETLAEATDSFELPSNNITGSFIRELENNSLTHVIDTLVTPIGTNSDMTSEEMVDLTSLGSEESDARFLSLIMDTSAAASSSSSPMISTVVDPIRPGTVDSDSSSVSRDTGSPDTRIISANMVDISSDESESITSPTSLAIPLLLPCVREDALPQHGLINTHLQVGRLDIDDSRNTDHIYGATGHLEVQATLPVISVHGMVTMSDLECPETVIDTYEQSEHKEPERAVNNLSQINRELQSYEDVFRQSGPVQVLSGDGEVTAPSRIVLQKAKKSTMPYNRKKSRKMTDTGRSSSSDNTRATWTQSGAASQTELQPVNKEPSTTSPVHCSVRPGCSVDKTADHSPVLDSGRSSVNHSMTSPWKPTGKSARQSASSRRHVPYVATRHTARKSTRRIGPMRARLTLNTTTNTPLCLSDREMRVAARRRSEELLSETRFNDMMSQRTFQNMDTC